MSRSGAMRTAALVLAVAAAGAAGTLLRLAAGQLVGEAEMRFRGRRSP
ncbi:hypothetical protein [Nesterenkonia pannonica]|nr:hypothetical protein [Nesterenkonia pannonica]